MPHPSALSRIGAFGHALLASAALALAISGAPALAEYPVTTMATVIDRAQIEDMLYAYVHGAAATADLIWTIIDCDSPKAKPRLSEEGREHDQLVKRGERWYLKSRVVTSDAGLAGIFVESYIKR
jgi:hypothetical protein